MVHNLPGVVDWVITFLSFFGAIFFGIIALIIGLNILVIGFVWLSRVLNGR